MYNHVFRDEARMNAYVRSSCYTVAGKSVLCRRIAHHLRAQQATGRLAILGADLGWNALLLGGMLPMAKLDLVEKSAEAIQHCRKVCPAGRCSYIHGDVRKVDINWSGYDAVLSLMFIHLIPQWRSLIRRIAVRLRPGSLLVIAEVDPNQWRMNPSGRASDARRRAAGVSISAINQWATRLGMNAVACETILRRDAIRVDEIPTVFSACANSALYEMSESELDSMHRQMSRRARRGVLLLELSARLIVMVKE